MQATKLKMKILTTSKPSESERLKWIADARREAEYDGHKATLDAIIEDYDKYERKFEMNFDGLKLMGSVNSDHLGFFAAEFTTGRNHWERMDDRLRDETFVESMKKAFLKSVEPYLPHSKDVGNFREGVDRWVWNVGNGA